MKEIELKTKLPSGDFRYEAIPVSKIEKYIYEALRYKAITPDEVETIVNIYQNNIQK